MDNIRNYITIGKMAVPIASVGSMKTLARSVERNAVYSDLNMEPLVRSSTRLVTILNDF